MFRGIQFYRSQENPHHMAYIDTDLNCFKKLSIAAGGDRKKLRRLSRMVRHLSSKPRERLVSRQVVISLVIMTKPAHLQITNEGLVVQKWSGIPQNTSTP